MPVDILLTVIATSIIQSLFGVGVLLFGTPLLLLLDYDFITALHVLLPISIAINTLQLLKHYSFVDRNFLHQVLIYTIPFVVLLLFIVSVAKINISYLVGTFLIIVALKNFSSAISRTLDALVKYEKAYLAAMGIIHGLSNLGGSLLTAIVHQKQYKKDTTRATVAVCYASFAVFQLLTLAFIDTNSQIAKLNSMALLQVGVIVFLFMEESVYSHLDNEKYSKIFAIFLFASGIVLITKSF